VKFQEVKIKEKSSLYKPKDVWRSRGIALLIRNLCKGRGKAIPSQALTGPEGSRRLRLLDFKTIGT
jgi:hypothetical protein